MRNYHFKKFTRKINASVIDNAVREFDYCYGDVAKMLGIRTYYDEIMCLFCIDISYYY